MWAAVHMFHYMEHLDIEVLATYQLNTIVRNVIINLTIAKFTYNKQFKKHNRLMPKPTKVVA